jgi:Flp pilus assembly protein TadG
VELGIIASVFLSMLLGVANIAMGLWTLSSLHYAAESAARYAAICAPSCNPAVTTFAASQYFGQSLAGNNPFSYSATGCGQTVTASYNYSVSIPFIGSFTVPLSTTACSP